MPFSDFKYSQWPMLEGYLLSYMGKTKIEWSEMVWNCIRGCSRISPGCINCYAERMAARNLPGMKSPTTGGPFAIINGNGPHWTGKVELIPHMLDVPLRRKKPTTWFVNSMSDLFHEGLPDQDIDRVWSVMALARHHVFQVLTKRSERLPKYLAECSPNDFGGLYWRVLGEANHHRHDYPALTRVPISNPTVFPLPNVWLGVSVESRDYLSRIDDLRRTPAAVRFLSLEPLLEDLGTLDLTGISWCIVGGESGPGARPMHPDWARSIRDQCIAAKVPFFFKQWGAWRDRRSGDPATGEMLRMTNCGRNGQDLANAEDGGDVWMQRLGKKAASNILDGRTWVEMPNRG